ncbi:MAG: magnesium transporter CorA family protein [Kiritimatiellae bacterium]|nr:magnesium transporter CorA family protein [Kiritimatiellia bacterium]MBR4603975.1 magnesium transporter CorA family protein [Kiritimatiellia bacterium]
MLTIYRWENGALKESPDFAPSCWINLVEPTTTELESVLTFSGVPRDFLTDPLDADERPRFDYDDDATNILIVHVPCPVEDEDSPYPYRTVPLGIILFRQGVITVCSAKTPVTTAFLDQIRRVCPPSDRYRFAFRLLWHGGVLFLRYLHDIHMRTNALEEEMHETISNEALLKLLTIEKTFVYFTTSLKADTIALARANTARQLSLTEDDRDQLEDAMVEYQQALETATIHANILNGTLDTFASLINNNLNNVMKYLTAATIMLAAPMIIASIYGMNIPLPFQNHAHAFPIVMVLSCILAGAFGAVFVVLYRKRRF